MKTIERALLLPHRPGLRGLLAPTLLGAALCSVSLDAAAQSAPQPPTEQPPTRVEPAPAAAPATPIQDTAPATAARAAANSVATDSRPTLAPRPQNNTLAPRPGLVTVVGSGAAAGEGTRALRPPPACTPKTNSLDCVADGAQAGQGANVSSKVRNSVIGEVGAGRATTEGGGGVKREGACTPLPGKLSCD